MLYVPYRFFLWGASSDLWSDLCSISDEEKITSVFEAEGTANIGTVAGVDEQGINMYAGGTDIDAGGAFVDAGDADVDAEILILTGGTNEGVRDFVVGLLIFSLW